jgi:AcrR family transcriptional regulator
LPFNTPMLPDKREHIINKAVELFAEKGFEGSSIRDLAKKAEVNIAMVNYYFGSKEKLYEALIEKRVLYMSATIDQIIRNSALSCIQQMDQIINSYIMRFLSDPLYQRVVQQELLVTHRKQVHQQIINLIVKNAKDVVSVIKKGIRKKEFKKADPELLFASILGTINQVMMSKTLCNLLMDKPADFNPYADKQFQKRLTTHIQQMTHALLIQ